MTLSSNKRQLLLDKRIRSVLTSGRMPSVNEMVSLIQRIIRTEADQVTKDPASYVESNVLKAEHYNEFAQAIEDDIETMRITVDEGWARLEDILTSSEFFIGLAHRADTLGKATKAALSRIPSADSYFMGAAISFDSAEDIDDILSRDYEIDSKAGTISIAKTSQSTIDPSSMTVISTLVTSAAGTPQIVTTGDPAAILSSSSAQMFLAEAYSLDDDVYHELVTHIRLADNASGAKLLTSVDVECGSIYDQMVSVWTTYDDENWELLGISSGKYRVTVTGSRRRATDVRVVIGKAKADGRRMYAGQWKNVYAFDLEHIGIYESAYAGTAEIVSNAIQLSTDGIATVVVISDEQAPDGTSVEYFVADEVVNAASLEDFAWTRVELGKDTPVGNVSLETDSFVCNSASKIISGSGATSDVWDIGGAAGEATEVYCGVDQAKVISSIVADPSALVIDGTGPSSGAKSYRDIDGTITLEGGNYYALSIGVWSKYPDSISIDLGFPVDSVSGEDYLISLNGRDITSQHDGRRVSFGVSSGRNSLTVVVRRADIVPFSLVIGKPAAHKIALMKPTIVANSMLQTTVDAISFEHGRKRVSFDPSGMNFEIGYRIVSEGMPSGAIRLRARMKSTPGSGTPSIRSWHIVSGT